MSANHLELENLVRLVLWKPESCTVNLRDETLDTTNRAPKPITLAFPKKDGTDPLGVKGDPFVKNSRFGKLDVKDFELYPYAQLTPTTWIVRLVITTSKTGSFFGGTAPTTSEVSTQVAVDASGKVLHCIGLTDSDLATVDNVNVVNEKICELAPDGAMVYDPVTKKCIKNTNCIEGTLNAAACPAGQLITGCDAVGAFTANPIIMTRPFLDGKARENVVSDWDCQPNRLTNTAACQYAVDADISKAKCRACCRDVAMPVGL